MAINLIDKLREFWNRKPITRNALIMMGILYLPVAFLHEFGHYLVGVHLGSLCGMKMDFLGFHVYCYPLPSTDSLYLPLGGIFGMIGSLSLLSFKRIRSNRGCLIGTSTMAFNHFLQFFGETYETNRYLHDLTFSMLLGILLSIFLISFIIIYNPKFRHRTKDKS